MIRVVCIMFAIAIKDLEIYLSNLNLFLGKIQFSLNYPIQKGRLVSK